MTRVEQNTLNFAANYYIRHCKELKVGQERLWNRLTDHNIALMERVAEAYSLSVADLALKVADIKSQLAQRGVNNDPI